jgi:hypothetical protein
MILTEQDSYWAAQKLVEYFSDFNRIDDYFRSRKIDRIKDMPTPLFGLGPEDELFQSFDMHPEDMNFEIVRRTGESFDNLLEMTASFSPDDPPGRNSKLCVQETNTGKIVGFIKLASPLINAKPRNDFLGRPLQTVDKEEMSRFNASTIMGFVIVPAQPFGFNYLGGKLLAAICCSHDIREFLDNKYGGPYCMFETTSLYGNIKGGSMYDGMRPFLRYKGNTESKFFLTFADDMYLEMRKWFEKRNGNEPLIHKEASSRKLKTQTKMIGIISQSLKKYNVDAHKKFVEFRRKTEGITTQKRFYMSTYGYANTKEYLLRETDTLVKGEAWARHSLENVISWWRHKAIKRYESLKANNKLRTELEIWRLNNIDQIDIIR